MNVLARRRRVDDDEDINDFDPAYFPKRVYRDGKGPTVKLMLTDSMPPDYRAAISRDRAMRDARWYYPPRVYVGDSAALRDAERTAYEARQSYIARLGDAWKNPTGQMQQPPDNGNGDDDDDEELSPRDRYIQNLQTAYRRPIGNGYSGEADAVQAAFMRRISPGARPGDEPDAIAAARRRRGTPGPPGVTFGHGPSRDAASLKDARAAADQAHAEYVARISNAWRR